MTLQEKDLQFVFDDSHWTGLLKFDETKDYKNASENLPETKGVDFTGVYQKHSLVLIEVKDFREHRIKNKPKFTDGPDALWLKVAQKYKNSVAVIVGAARNSTHEKETFQSYLEILKNEGKQFFLILWLEQDTPLAMKNKKLKSNRQEYLLLQDLKKSLKWLTTKVNVIDASVNMFKESLTVNFTSDSIS
ncbi:MAG: DUF6661 family protein [Saprospiraceae bacterium]